MQLLYFQAPRLTGGAPSPRMFSRYGRLAALVALLMLTKISPAAALYGTTTSGTLAYNPTNIYSLIGDSNNPNLGWVNSMAGFEFSLPAGSYQLDSFTLALRSPISDVQTTFTLYSGSNRPQTSLASVTLTLPFSGSSFSLDTIVFPGSPTLSGLQNYFLIGSVPQETTGFEQIDWAGSSPGSAVPFVYGQTWLTGQFAPNGFLGWNNTTFSSGPAWQLAVDAAAAPEPALMLLTGVGLIAIGVLRVRRRS
jgi:hypothetical protein